MSLLTKISKLFSKNQHNQVVGIALQQHGISLCSIPSPKYDKKAEINALAAKGSLEEPNHEQTPLESNTDDLVLFQEQKVTSGDFSEQLEQLKSDLALSGQAHLVLNDHQTQIVQVDKPSVPEAEICGALKWQIKDLVTISPDNMVLDYFDAPALNGAKAKINVVCASLSELKAMVAAINQGDVELCSITTQEFAFANLLPIQKEACLLVCQQPNEEIVLLIVKDGQLHFNRRLRGFAQIANKSEDELAMNIIDNLSLEIQRSTDYYERQLKQAPIRELKVLLPIALEGFFARKLTENTNMAVGLLSLPKPYHEQRQYAAAIGAALGQKRAASAKELV